MSNEPETLSEQVASIACSSAKELNFRLNEKDLKFMKTFLKKFIQSNGANSLPIFEEQSY